MNKAIKIILPIKKARSAIKIISPMKICNGEVLTFRLWYGEPYHKYQCNFSISKVKPIAIKLTKPINVKVLKSIK